MGTEAVDMPKQMLKAEAGRVQNESCKKSWVMDLGATLGGGQISTQNLVPQFPISLGDFSLVGGWTFCFFLLVSGLHITTCANYCCEEHSKNGAC